jgi:hypothetical protein
MNEPTCSVDRDEAFQLFIPLRPGCADSYAPPTDRGYCGCK